MRSSGVSVLGLLWIMIAVGSSVIVHVRPVTYHTGCIRCINPCYLVTVYRECGGEDGMDVLLVFNCNSNSIKYCKPGVLLNTSSRCWIVAENDPCVYKNHCPNPNITDVITDVRVLDGVLIFNITMNSTWLGLDMAVRVHYSAGAVTWEVDNGYQLIDDNRTLIIPSVQRDDAERRFRVRITNPVIEDTWDCQLAIGVSDPVLLSNITCNSSRLGEDVDMSVFLSEEDKAVAKDVDWVPFPEKKRLMDDNGTLRDDAKRSFGVGITFLIPEETWKYWRENRENYPNGANEGISVGIIVAITVSIIGVIALVTVLVIICIKRRKRSRNRMPETATQNGAVYTSVLTVPPQDGSVPAVTENDESVAITVLNGSVPAVAQGNGSVPAVAQGNGSVPAVAQGSGSVPAVAQT